MSKSEKRAKNAKRAEKQALAAAEQNPIENATESQESIEESKEQESQEDGAIYAEVLQDDEEQEVFTLRVIQTAQNPIEENIPIESQDSQEETQKQESKVAESPVSFLPIVQGDSSKDAKKVSHNPWADKARGVAGFVSGTKNDFIMTRLLQGKYTRADILAELNKAYPGANNKTTLGCFLQGLQCSPGTYSESRGLTVLSSDGTKTGLLKVTLPEGKVWEPKTKAWIAPK